MSNLNLIPVRGKVNHGGDRIAGEHFVSARNGDLYTITLIGTNFSQPPVALVTVDTTHQGGSYTASASLHNITRDSFEVSIQNMNASNIEAAFDFICVGAE